jgi:undecaprenyl pyrophosphate synthase
VSEQRANEVFVEFLNHRKTTQGVSAMPSKNVASISVGDLAEVISHSVLNAVERRINVEKFIAENNAIIVNPMIRYGGWIILAREGALRGLQIGETGVGGG